MPGILASRQFELELLTAHSSLAGMDEVGRGALASPITVDACTITGSEGEAPSDLTDPRLLSAKRREELAPQICSWTAASTVTWASNKETDRFGIIVGLRLAGVHTLARIKEKIGAPALVLLDGSHDWLTPPEDLFASLERPEMPDMTPREVMTRVRTDTQYTLTTAASMITKVTGDEHITKLEDPGYG